MKEHPRSFKRGVYEEQLLVEASTFGDEQLEALGGSQLTGVRRGGGRGRRLTLAGGLQPVLRRHLVISGVRDRQVVAVLARRRRQRRVIGVVAGGSAVQRRSRADAA